MKQSKKGSDQVVSVMWFRRDLRLEDNVALKKAFEESDQLLLLFHVNPKQFLSNDSLNQSAFFQSVEKLKQVIESKKGILHILYGDLESSFKKLKKEVPEWSDIYINRDETGFGLERDKEAKKIFDELGILPHGYHDHYVHSAGDIKTDSGNVYKVFTPYFEKWKERGYPEPVNVPFKAEKLLKKNRFSQDEKKFHAFLKQQTALCDYTPGTEEAHHRLSEFVEKRLENYGKDRDYPLKDGTSCLSRHLRTGEISIRTVLHRVLQEKNSEGKHTFIKKLAWRDFYNMVYAAHPDQKEVSINPAFRQIKWENDEVLFEKWTQGKTGYPLVDAAMRHLNQTGWMHNRLRMIVASFLTKDLLIDWRWGEKYFQKMLVDYDPASNIGGWQWAASTGTDSMPYFRIFNPTTQSEKYDKDGDFIRKWVPELKEIESKKIHEPVRLSQSDQTQWHVEIGREYPEPIVDHKERRKKAIEVFEQSKSN